MPHIHYALDMCVGAFIVDNGCVLLRYHDKYPEWFGAGGHVEVGEDPVTAIHREVLEETGLTIRLHSPYLSLGIWQPETLIHSPFATDLDRVSDTHMHCSLMYAASVVGSNVLKPAEGEPKCDMIWLDQIELGLWFPKIGQKAYFYAMNALHIVEQCKRQEVGY